MPADIEERAQSAVASSRHEDRYAAIVIGAEGAGYCPLGSETHQDGMLPEQDLLLAGEVVRIRVDRGVIAPGRIGHACRSGLDVVQ
jgi:hypothetical protein